MVVQAITALNDTTNFLRVCAIGLKITETEIFAHRI